MLLQEMPCLEPLKALENHGFNSVFSGYRNGTWVFNPF